MIDLSALAGRTVLVTGHTGFSGSWLCLWLSRLGARVVGLALEPPTEPSLFEVADVASAIEGNHLVDLADSDAVAAVVRETAPDLVLHLAAQSLVSAGYREPYRTLSVNVLGTAAVLDAVRLLDRPVAVVVVTSDKCYADLDSPAPHRESDPMGGADPYSASKGAAELVVDAYRRSFFGSADRPLVATARAGNVIGGGDWAPNRIVPDAVRAFAAGRPVPVRNPTATRPWQHVLEPLSGYLTLGARLVAGERHAAEAWNFGPVPGEEVPVADLVDRLGAAWGKGSWEPAGEGAGIGGPEAPRLRLAIDKAAGRLGWWPRWDLDQTVERTVGWYRRFHDGGGAPMQTACLDDIAAYEAAGAVIGS